LLSSLVMAAVGLPPFGLFFGFMDMALHSNVTALSGDLLIVLLAWFGASWYLFKLLQRLLFGPPRSDLIYRDLGGVEIASLVLVLGALIGVGVWSVSPNARPNADRLTHNSRSVIEVVSK
jgi:NADH-quinone oxidoreductase subunit M